MEKSQQSSERQPKRGQIPCVEGMFTLPSSTEIGNLIGSKCTKCGKIFFPKMSVCLNCAQIAMEQVPLSRRGVLYCYSVVYQKIPGSMMDPPFAAIIVELPEGIQVRSVLAGVDPGKLDMNSIGRTVEIVFEKMKEDEEGNDMITFKYSFV